MSFGGLGAVSSFPFVSIPGPDLDHHVEDLEEDIAVALALVLEEDVDVTGSRPGRVVLGSGRRK